MKRKLSSLLIASALSVMAMEAKAFSYTITNADGSAIDMTTLPGVTDLTVTAAPDMSYTITNVGDLNTLGLGSGISGTSIVGLGAMPSSTITDVFDVSAIPSVSLSNLNIMNLNVSSGSVVDFGQIAGFDGGHITTATVTHGELYLNNLTNIGLGSTFADYQTTADTINATSNGVNNVLVGFGSAYIDTLNISGVGAPNREYASSYFTGDALIRNLTINYGQLEQVQGQNQIDNLTMIDSQAAFYDKSHVNQLVFSDEKSVLEVGSVPSVMAITAGSLPQNELTTFGGTTGATAVEWSIVGGNQFAKLVVVENDTWGGSGPVFPTTINSNGDTVYNAAIINASDSTQTAIKLTGDNISFDLTTLDDNYINIQDWVQGYLAPPRYRYDSDYFGGGIHSASAARKQNLINVTSADATLLELNGNLANLTLEVGGEGWDLGGIRVNGSDNTIAINNVLYDGFIALNGDANRALLMDFKHLSRITASGLDTNYVYLDSNGPRTIAFGNVNTSLTTNIIDNISGNIDLYLSTFNNATRVNLQDAQAYGDIILDVTRLSLSNSTLTLNRSNPLTVGTLVDRDVFTITGSLRTDGAAFIGDSSLVDMGAGRNTDLRILGDLRSDSGDSLRVTNYTLSLNENTGDHIYIGGQFHGTINLDLGTITDIGHGDDSIELVAAPNDNPNGERVTLSGTNVSYNNITKFYTMGTSPYAWSVSRIPAAGYYLSNLASSHNGSGGTPVFTPVVNTSIAAPIAATHFLGSNISQSIADYMQTTPLGVSHDKNMWGQYVYQKQKQDVIGGLSYTAKMTGWDIGVDVSQEHDSRWGLAASYRGLTNDLKVDVAGLSDASTGMDAVLLSAYGTRAHDAHVWDGQFYVGQAWANHNMFGEGKQEKDKGILWGGYGQYGYRHTMDHGLTVTPTIGVNYHETQWSDSSISDGHNRYTRMYLELPLSGQTDNGLTWSIAPRYSYNFNADDNVHINGVSEPVKVADMREEYGVSATLTQKTENNGTWYIKLSNDQLKEGDRTNITIGGSWSF